MAESSPKKEQKASSSSSPSADCGRVGTVSLYAYVAVMAILFGKQFVENVYKIRNNKVNVEKTIALEKITSFRS